MKIFNWVHRRFHHKYDEAVGEDVTETEFTGNGKDKLSLHENTAFMDSTTTAFGSGWKEGILAIGTFGLDPAAAILWEDFEVHKDNAYLCEFRPFGGEEYLCDDYGGDQQEEEEEEIESPLVLKAYCKHGFFHDENFKPNYHNDQDGKVANKKAGGERITLADLFWAHDSSSEKKLKNKKTHDHDHEDQAIKVQYNHNTDQSNMNTNIKHANSLYDNDDEDDRVDLISMKKLKTTKDHAAARPIKKINLMVRKMLKNKKIHPEVENRKDTAVRLKHMRIPQSVKNNAYA